MLVSKHRAAAHKAHYTMAKRKFEALLDWVLTDTRIPRKVRRELEEEFGKSKKSS